MGMQETTEAVVDTFGLPDYKVTKLLGEIDPDNHDIRLICGHVRFRQLTWLYTATLSPEDLLTFSRYCERLALEAFNMRELQGKRRLEGAH